MTTPTPNLHLMKTKDLQALYQQVTGKPTTNRNTVYLRNAIAKAQGTAAAPPAHAATDADEKPMAPAPRKPELRTNEHEETHEDVAVRADTAERHARPEAALRLWLQAADLCDDPAIKTEYEARADKNRARVVEPNTNTNKEDTTMATKKKPAAPKSNGKPKAKANGKAEKFEHDARVAPYIGKHLVKEYKGKEHRVHVGETGFTYDGEKFDNLSAERQQALCDGAAPHRPHAPRRRGAAVVTAAACTMVDYDVRRPLARWSNGDVEVVATVRRGELRIVSVCGRAVATGFCPTVEAIESLDDARTQRAAWVDLAEELGAWESLADYWDELE